MWERGESFPTLSTKAPAWDFGTCTKNALGGSNPRSVPGGVREDRVVSKLAREAEEEGWSNNTIIEPPVTGCGFLKSIKPVCSSSVVAFASSTDVMAKKTLDEASIGYVCQFFTSAVHRAAQRKNGDRPPCDHQCHQPLRLTRIFYLLCPAIIPFPLFYTNVFCRCLLHHFEVQVLVRFTSQQP